MREKEIVETVTTHAYLDNITLTRGPHDSDSCETPIEIEIIPDTVWIRTTQPEDLAKTKRSKKDPMIRYPPNQDGVIIEWVHNKLSASTEYYNLIDRTVLALRLLKPGEVFISETFDWVNDDTEFSNHIWSLTIPHPWDSFRRRYELYTSDKEALNEIPRRLMNVDFTKETSYRIACDRFGRFYYDISIEDQLIDLCISFEALYNKGNKQQHNFGVGYVIGLAASMLLGSNAHERDTITDNLRSAFSIRNKIVHGSESDFDKAYALIPILEDYLRKSLYHLMPV